MINIQKLSRAFEAKTLGEAEIDEVRALCCENELFYSYCPPFVTAESIRADMRALPKNKEQKDKLYVGFYDASELVAVMDLILAYPDDETCSVRFVPFCGKMVSAMPSWASSREIRRVFAFGAKTVLLPLERSPRKKNT